jgi:hypothetical protein
MKYTGLEFIVDMQVIKPHKSQLSLAIAYKIPNLEPIFVNPGDYNKTGMHYLSGGERHKIYANKQFPISPMSIGYMK